MLNALSAVRLELLGANVTRSAIQNVRINLRATRLEIGALCRASFRIGHDAAEIGSKVDRGLDMQ